MTPHIAMPCDDPECDGSVVFEMPDGATSTGRLTGRCEVCGARFDLYGGKRRRLSRRSDERTC